MKKIVYRSKPFNVEEEDMLVNGSIMHVKRVVVGRDAAVILAILPGNRIILERNYRPVIKRWIYELPAGHIEKGDSGIKTVRKELSEETGYRAKHIKKLFEQYPDPGKIEYMSHFYIATGLTKGAPHREEHEQIIVKIVTLEKALKMIDGNVINDSKTIAGILYYTRRFR